MEDLKELFLHHLRDIYYAERRGLKAHPKLADATVDQAAKAA